MQIIERDNPSASELEPSTPNVITTQTILIADCGSAFTKLALIGLVEGQYRLVAQAQVATTTQTFYQNITAGIILAASEIERTTGLQITEYGELKIKDSADSTGIDAFVCVYSAGTPVRLLVTGSKADESVKVAKALSAGFGCEIKYIETPIPAPDKKDEKAAHTLNVSTPEEDEWKAQVHRLAQFSPQTILLLADSNASRIEATENLIKDLLAYLDTPNLEASKPTIISTGNAGITHKLAGKAEIISIPSVTSQSAISAANTLQNSFHRALVTTVPGFQEVSSLSTVSPMHSSRSTVGLVKYLAKHYLMNVIGIDVGSSTTSIYSAREDGKAFSSLHPRAGTGIHIGQVLKSVGYEAIARWLPFEMNESGLRQYALKRTAFPYQTPETLEDVQIDLAFAREAIRLAIQEDNLDSAIVGATSDLILATGGTFAHVPYYSLAALALLDVIQPHGISSLVLDKAMLAPMLGLMAKVNPIAAVQVTENDAVMHRLGTCIAPFGSAADGDLALKVQLEYADGRITTANVAYGSIKVIPLAVNERALLTLFPAPTIDVGLGPGKHARAGDEIDGGLIGLIIDARGRPFNLDADPVTRRWKLLSWLQEMGVPTTTMIHG